VEKKLDEQEDEFTESHVKQEDHEDQDWKGMLFEQEKKTEHYKLRYIKLKEERKTWEAQGTQYETEVKDLEAKLAEHTQEREDMQQEREGMQQEREGMQQEREGMQQEIENMHAKISRQRQTNKEGMQAHSKLLHKYREQKATKTWEAQGSQYETKVKTSKDKLAVHTQMIKELEARLSRQKQTYKEKAQAYLSLLRKYEEEKGTNMRLKQELDQKTLSAPYMARHVRYSS
jgi:chromosome segregation ATPase